MSIFAKTPKGHEEIETRSGGLHPRMRRLLILIDGVRATEALASMLNDGRFEETLAGLEAEGYIERAVGSPPVTSAESVSMPAVTPAPGGEGQLELARNFMMNTLKAFNGPYNKLSLMQRIHGCSNREELQALFADWLSSINETHAGRKRAEELTERLQAVM
ncbi:hypothetical protein J5J83_03825 [Azoarcus sp. L1K30]|uniref:hypothetical protein n=1 Tax=Azoarcus sp. L1K30 TaxID=2820277 RepID=UPI001B83D008|nr:hypothetical protein [Azoarcus sp. L1K30]MBR0565245.1 hypothetical protein [Azoarcus sp. L1K30]